MARAAAAAANLAARATRWSKDRKAFRHEPDAVASRILRLIGKIELLDDTVAGGAKQSALSEAWTAYQLVQQYLDHPSLDDVEYRALVDSVDDVVAVADFDGYAESRIDSEQIASDTLYEGWPEGYSDWN
jgi:hypothetical protein